MNKKEIIKELANKTNLRQPDVRAVVDALSDTIIDNVKINNDVKIANFGTFKLVRHNDRIGRNPTTDEKLLIPAHHVIRFLPSRKFKNIAKSVDD